MSHRQHAASQQTNQAAARSARRLVGATVTSLKRNSASEIAASEPPGEVQASRRWSISPQALLLCATALAVGLVSFNTWPQWLLLITVVLLAAIHWWCSRRFQRKTCPEAKQWTNVAVRTLGGAMAGAAVGALLGGILGVADPLLGMGLEIWAAAKVGLALGCVAGVVYPRAAIALVSMIAWIP